MLFKKSRYHRRSSKKIGLNKFFIISFITFFACWQNSFALVTNVVGLFVKPYATVSLSDYSDGNTREITKYPTNTKLAAGIRVINLVSLEADYSNFRVSKYQSNISDALSQFKVDGALKSTYDVQNYGVSLHLNLPIIRLLGNGLETVIGGGMTTLSYKDTKTGVKLNQTSPKITAGLRFLFLNTFAATATVEVMTKKHPLAKSTPVISSLGFTYLFW
jgi:hypothetical protein